MKSKLKREKIRKEGKSEIRKWERKNKEIWKGEQGSL